MPAEAGPTIIIIGGDALALSVARELSLVHSVVILWPPDPEFAAEIERLDVRFVPGRPERREDLVGAGVQHARAILALSRDDPLNLQSALRARDANPAIRIVLRQFNRALAAKIEQNLDNCSVVSLAWHSAATYAAAALDPSCFRGLQFPERDGPLTGFAHRIADREDVAGRKLTEAEQVLGARIIAVDGDWRVGGDDPIAPGARLVVFGRTQQLLESTPQQLASKGRGGRLRDAIHRAYSRLRRVDGLLAGFAAAALGCYVIGTIYFYHSFSGDLLKAAYFVLTTMTTTGFGDIAPSHGRPLDIGVAMLLMLAGTSLAGVLVAYAASLLTRAQWVRVQGLRPIHRRGHVVICGAGSIGAGVIDLLLESGKPLVVIESQPEPALVERARDHGIELLTGDASRDETLELCNLSEAHSLLALTNLDTLNLEIALGARARNPNMPVILRIAEASFAASIARHFQFNTTFSVAAMAGPVFAGLLRGRGARGRIGFDGQEFAIVEFSLTTDWESDVPEGAIPLAITDERGGFALVRDPAAFQPGVRVLALLPANR